MSNKVAIVFAVCLALCVASSSAGTFQFIIILYFLKPFCVTFWSSDGMRIEKSYQNNVEQIK